MENLSDNYPTVLPIADSDSGGCAGIQTAIKSISANGAYAASVITATTAQNTVGVTDIHAIPLAHIEKQLDAVLSYIEFDAIKIGMLHSPDVIELVKSKLVEFKCSSFGVGHRRDQYQIDFGYQWDIPTSASINQSRLLSGEYNNSTLDVGIHWLTLSVSLNSP